MYFLKQIRTYLEARPKRTPFGADATRYAMAETLIRQANLDSAADLSAAEQTRMMQQLQPSNPVIRAYMTERPYETWVKRAVPVLKRISTIAGSVMLGALVLGVPVVTPVAAFVTFAATALMLKARHDSRGNVRRIEKVQFAHDRLLVLRDGAAVYDKLMGRHMNSAPNLFKRARRAFESAVTPSVPKDGASRGKTPPSPENKI